MKFLKKLSTIEKAKLLTGHSIDLLLPVNGPESETEFTVLDTLVELGEEFSKLITWMNVKLQFDPIVKVPQSTDLKSVSFKNLTKLATWINDFTTPKATSIILIPLVEIESRHTFVASPFNNLRFKKCVLQYREVGDSQLDRPRMVSEELLDDFNKEQVRISAMIRQKEAAENTRAMLADDKQFPALGA